MLEVVKTPSASSSATALRLSLALGGKAGLRVVDQDAAHHGRGDAEKMRAIAPVDGVLA